MSVNLKGLIGKLNDTTRAALEAAAGLVPVAHALRRRDRAFPDEAAGCERQRCRQDLSSVQRGHFAPAEGAGAQPGQAEERERAHAGVQSLSVEDADGGLDDRLARLRRDADPQRPRAAGSAARTTELARIARDIGKELQKIQPELLRKDFAGDRRRDAGRYGRADGGGGFGWRRRRGAARRREDAESRSVHGRSDRQRAQGQDRSGAGARCRDPAGDRYSDAAPAEQSDSDGRSGRGKDGRGGRIRAADRAGRRASAA